MSVSTQLVPSVVEQSTAVPTDLIWRLSVEQYHQMIQAGILTEDDPEFPDYHQRQDYDLSDTVPVVIEGREVGRLDVREMLPF